MKRLSNLLAALVFASLVIFMSCGGSETPPAPAAGEVQAGLLQGTWNVSGSPTYDGGIEGDWSGFTLTLSNFSDDGNGVWGGNYAASGIPAGYGQVWGDNADASVANGTWDFASATNVTSVISGDGITASLGVDANGETLSVSFTVPSSSARTSGIFDETWVFQFTK